MEQAYEWVDGYVFIRSKKSWLPLCGDWQKDWYRYVARLLPAGPDADRIAVFCEVPRSEKDAAQKLKEKIDKAISRANPTSSSGTAVLVGPDGPTRWSTKKKWGAYLRITAESGQAKAVFDRLQPGKDAPFGDGEYYGHALCEGDWDVLLELGSDSPQGLDELVARALGLPGVNSAATIVSKIQNDITKPPKPTECKEWVND
jgi:hypothetical protein